MAPDPQPLYRVFDPATERPVFARRGGDGEWVAVPATIEKMHKLQLRGQSLPSGRRLDEQARILAPIRPSKIVCVGLNYAHHAEEMNKSVPDEPLLFMKPPTALIGPGDTIELPAQSGEVHHEGELAIVIGEQLRDGDEIRASQAIFGYSCACDVTARDIQRREKRYTRAKGFDTFAPLGPAIAPASSFEPANHELTCRVDGVVRQRSTLDDFIFPPSVVVSFISRVMTLLAGDVILTGTPAGVGPIEPGQIVTVEIDGIGVLENPVGTRDDGRSARS